jgi:hypothetical protein
MYVKIVILGVPVPGTFMDVKVFDPMRPTVCLPLGPRNTPVTERWELVNLAGERDRQRSILQITAKESQAPNLFQRSHG